MVRGDPVVAIRHQLPTGAVAPGRAKGLQHGRLHVAFGGASGGGVGADQQGDAARSRSRSSASLTMCRARITRLARPTPSGWEAFPAFNTWSWRVLPDNKRVPARGRARGPCQRFLEATLGFLIVRVVQHRHLSEPAPPIRNIHTGPHHGGARGPDHQERDALVAGWVSPTA